MWIQLKFFISTIELILNLKLGLGHNVYIRCPFETFMSTISLSSVVQTKEYKTLSFFKQNNVKEVDSRSNTNSGTTRSVMWRPDDLVQPRLTQSRCFAQFCFSSGALIL